VTSPASQPVARKFIIRSMSTTDYVMAYRSGGELIPEQKPVPYHVFLRRPDKRQSAFWSRFQNEAMTFATAEDAQVEAHKIELTSFDIVPSDFAELGISNYWDKN
jgi:hypothetical protein